MAQLLNLLVNDFVKERWGYIITVYSSGNSIEIVSAASFRAYEARRDLEIATPVMWPSRPQTRNVGPDHGSWLHRKAI